MGQAKRHELSQRPTLAVVARAAGVSTATASKVFKNRPDVAPETRRRVLVALEELGYQPTTIQRVEPRDPVVVVVFDTLVNPYSAQVLRGVLTGAREMSVDIVVEVINDNPGANRPLSKSWLKSIAQKGWTGVLAVTTEITPKQSKAVREAGLCLVAIDPPNALDDSLVSVGSTNFIGGIQATNHLIELGHNRIAVAAGPLGSSVARERVHGYRSALEAAELVYDEKLTRHGEFIYRDGVAMGLALLSLPQPPTAIVAGCDSTALGLLESARRLGLIVPQDLSIVGFDDSPAAGLQCAPADNSAPADGRSRPGRSA